MNDNENRSRNYVVLGASGGIGSCVVSRLRQQGCGVFVASRESDHLRQMSADFGFPTMMIDATKFDEVDGCFKAACEIFGKIDGAVNCVGSLLLKPAHLTGEKEWQETIAKNLTSSFATVRSAAKVMRRDGGSVILLSSAAARIGLSNHEAIAAAKAGVLGLAQSAAASYAAKNIRFNVVAPGLVKTKLTQRIWENDRNAQTSESMHALGRLGEPDEVASLITWLLAPENSWVTGEVFSIDGGLSNVKTNVRG